LIEPLEDRRLLAPGDLDLTFGGDGKVTTDFGASSDGAYALAIDGYGRTVVVGHTSDGSNYDFAVTRYNADGTLDSSFDGDGKLTTDFGGGLDRAQGVAIDGDGRIVVAGWSRVDSYYDLALARYSVDGTLDSSFDGDGRLTADFGATDYAAHSVAIDGNGRIIVAGYSRTGGVSRFAVARFNADGSVDTSFDGDGNLTTSIGDGCVAHSLAIDGEGRIVVAGNAYVPDEQSDFAVARYRSNGALDTTFDMDGKLTTHFGPNSEFAYSVAIDSTGRIVVAGIAFDSTNTTDFALARYNLDGSLDTSFDGDGKLTTAIGTSSDYAYSVAIDGNGKIVVAGTQLGDDSDFVVARYNADGSLDTSFDADGIAVTALGGNYDDARAVVIDGYGRIVVAGTASIGTDADLAVVRYEGDGSLNFGKLDVSFDGDGKLTTAIGAGAETAVSVVIDGYGRIVVAGFFHNGSDFDFAVARYAADGSLDTSFGVDGKATLAVGTSNDIATSAALDGDGKIVVAGSSVNGTNYDFALARFHADGTLDVSFDGDGMLTTAVGPGHDYIESMVIDGAGRIVVAGYSWNGANFDFVLARYNADGSLDTTFDGDGKLTTAIGTGHDYIHSATIDGNGKIVAAGVSYVGSNLDIALARYNTDGSLDTSFSDDGKLTTAIGTGHDYALSATIDGSGKILVAGQSYVGSQSDFALVRYLTNGSLDMSFGVGGKVTTAIGAGNDTIEEVAIDSNGKIVAAGYSHNGSNSDFALARYNEDGSLDISFDSDGKQTTDFDTSGDVGRCLAIDGYGRIIVAGQTDAGGDTDFALARYGGGVPTFTPGSVFVADNFSPYDFVDVTAGGDFAGQPSFASLPGRSPGQIAWSTDLQIAYVTQYDTDTVVAVSATGAVSTFATGIDGPTGIIQTSTGKLLVASYPSGKVFDITAGGNFTGATAFATGLSGPRNFMELPTGEVLVAEQGSGQVTDIADGGNLSSATPYASGLNGVHDLTLTPDRRLFAAANKAVIGVYEITGGGDFSAASAFAWGRLFFGLAVDAGNRLLAIPQNGNQVFDITAGGDFTSAAPFAYNLPISGETPLDTVPSTTTVTLDVFGNLLIADTAAGGKDDRWTLRKVGTAIQITDLDGRAIHAGSVPGATGSGTATVMIPYTSFTGEVRVLTHAGDDTLTVDFSGGNPIPSGGVDYDGGTGGSDAVEVTGGSFGTVVHAFTGAGAGDIDLDNDGAPDLFYTALEPFLMTSGTADLVLDITSAGITDAVLRDYTGVGDDEHSELAFTGHSGEDFQFQPPSNSLKIVTHGSSIVSISGFDSAFDTPSLIFEDGSGTASRFALAAADVIPDSTSLTITGDAVFDLNGHAETINGLSGDGTVDNTAGSTDPWLTVGHSGASSTFSGVIQQTTGSVSLKKTGIGELTLSGIGSDVTELQVNGGGALTVTGGLNSHGNTFIGTDGNGTLNWSGSGTLGSGNGWLGGGENAGATGTINVTGGELIFSAGAAEGFYLGHGGTGILDVSGGTVTINSNGRPVYIGGVPGFGLNESTTGTVIVRDDGILNVAGTGTFLFGADYADASGTVNLDGGTLQTARSFAKGTGSATINFNGGTLQAAGDNPVWLQGLTAANVEDGGAVIDTQGYTVGIVQPLLNAGSGGLTKRGAGVLDLAKPSTYAGATNVEQGTLRLQPPVAGSAVWLDATDVNGDSVENNPSDATKIGSGTHPWVNKGTLAVGSGTQSTVDYQPALSSGHMNGRDVLTFLRNDVYDPLPYHQYPQYLEFSDPDLNGLVNSAHTIFAVAKATTGAGPQGAQGLVIFPGQHSGLTLDGEETAATADSHQWIGGADVKSTSGYTQGDVAVLTSLITGSSTSGPSSNQLFVNGSPATQENRAQALKAYSNGLLRIGGANPPGSGWEWGLTGEIAEVVIYDRALSEAERQEVEAYLSYKWQAEGDAVDVIPPATAVTVSDGATLDLNGVDQTIGSLSGVAGSVVVLGSGTLSTGSAGSTAFAGSISGSGGLVKQGSSTFTLSGANTYTGATTVSQGTLALVSAASNNNIAHSTTLDVQSSATLDVSGLDNGALTDTLVLASGQTLMGKGTVTGKLTAASGAHVAPGASPGVLIQDGDLTLNSGSHLDIEIGGNAPGNGDDNHDQVQVTGTVSLGGATLNVSAFSGYTPAAGDQYVIVANDADEAVIGTLTGGMGTGGGALAEGAVVSNNFLASGKTARITYLGGDGNDVAIVVDAPNLVISDDDGLADTFRVKRDETGSNLQVFNDDTLIFSVPFAGVTSLAINGEADQNDSLFVDFVNGNPIPSGGLDFHGGSGGDDDLTVESGSVTNFTYTPFDPAGPDGPGSGEFDIDGSKITFTGLEPTLVTLSAANVTIDMSSLGAGEEVTVADTGTTTDKQSYVDFANANIEDMSFTNPTNLLKIIGTGFADTIRIDALDTRDADGNPLAAAVTVEAGGGNDAVDVQGLGAGFAAALIIRGDAGNDTLDASVLDLNVTLDGGAGNDTLTSGSGNDTLIDGTGDDNLTAGAGDDTFVLTPGSADVVNDSGGNDTVDFSAAGAGITIDMDSTAVQTVSGADTVQLNGQIENFVGSDFADTIFMLPLTVVRSVEGNDPGAPTGDTLIVDGQGQQVAVAGGQVAVPGFQPIGYTEIESLDVRNEVVRWKDAVSGNWTDASKWDVGRVPGAQDHVYVDATGSGYTVTLNTDVTSAAIGSFTMDSSSAVFAATSRTFTVNGTSSIQAGRVEWASSTWTTGSLVNEGAFMARRLDDYGGTSTINGPFTNAASGTLWVQGYRDFFTLDVTSGMTNAGTLYLDTVGQYSNYSYSITLNVTGGALVNTGLIESLAQEEAGTCYRNLNAELDNRGTFNVRSGVNLYVNSPGANHSNSGQISVSYGNLVVTGIGSFENTATGTISGRSVTLTGQGSGSGATWTNAGDITLASGGLSISGYASIANSGSIDVSGGDVGISGYTTLTNTGDMTIGSGRTLTVSGGTFEHQPGATLTGEGTISFNSSTVDVTGAYTTGTTPAVYLNS